MAKVTVVGPDGRSRELTLPDDQYEALKDSTVENPWESKSGRVLRNELDRLERDYRLNWLRHSSLRGRGYAPISQEAWEDAWLESALSLGLDPSTDDATSLYLIEKHARELVAEWGAEAP